MTTTQLMALLLLAVVKQLVNVRPCIRRIILHAVHHVAQRHCVIFTREAVVVVVVVVEASIIILIT
jgi:hypothetical protein